MCGIAGLYSKISTPIANSDLAAIFSLLESRGPDAKGHKRFAWNSGLVDLIHCRLAIIDLDQRGSQPMVSYSGRTWISFNGEIYNFKSIKQRLRLEGSHFATETDTEVILEAYEQWGLDKTLAALDGMFAFALFDTTDNRLVLARDKLGKKPLYYAWDGSDLYFSSDIRVVKSLLPNVGLDYRSLDYYFTELSTPQPRTIWSEISQLLPAHYLKICPEMASPIANNYWRLDEYKPADISLIDAIGKTEQLLRQAVRKRLVADVPIACLLSGGVDSGLVTALMAEESSTPVNTFSVGFSGNTDFNELDEARELAEKYNCNHHEIIVDDNLLSGLEDVLSYMGEPFADSSILPSMAVYKAIGSQYKVAFSGDGGDELFGGYNDYGMAYRSSIFAAKYPSKPVQFLISQADKVLSRLVSRTENMGAYYEYLYQSAAQKLYRGMGFWDKKALYSGLNNNVCLYYSSEFLEQLWLTHSGDGSITQQLMRSSLHTRLLNDYLPKVDRASMYSSLEVRSPLLDIDLLEFAFSLPDEYKFHQNNNKYILKAIAKRKIATDILNRKKKGFNIPVGQWLRQGAKDWGYAMIESLSKRSLFNSITLKQLWDANQASTTEVYAGRLWLLICFEIWANNELD